MNDAPGRRRIALVVPSILDDGGVPAVAMFVKDTILRSGEFDLKVISLATSSRDECGVGFLRPVTWLRGVTVRHGTWEGLPCTHVGAWGSEVEWRRFARRKAFDDLVADCDLIQVVGGCPAWALPAVGLGKPVVLQVATRARVERRRRARVERGPVAWWRRAMTFVTDRLDDRALREVDAVLVENPWMLRYATQVGGPCGTQVRYAPPGIDAAYFHPGASLPDDASSSPILAVGRFDDPRKNIEVLLEAYALMRQSGRAIPRLQLAGGGDPGRAFWARAKELGVESHVDFHLKPTRDELRAHYHRASCFALPSDEEGFGVVVAEAMSCGIPVVATRCGGPDGIITDGVDGYLVPIGDSRAMADRLLGLVTDPASRQAMGKAARRTVEARFAREVAGEPFLDTYRELLRSSTMQEPCAA